MHNEERRKHRRVELQLAAVLSDGKVREPCEVLNLSQGGAFVHTHQLRSVGSEFDLAWKLETGQGTFRARSVVVHRSNAGPGDARGMGVKFLGLTTLRKYQLRRLIRIWKDESPTKELWPRDRD